MTPLKVVDNKNKLKRLAIQVSTQSLPETHRLKGRCPHDAIYSLREFYWQWARPKPKIQQKSNLTCFKCNQTFARSSTLQRHQSEKHSDRDERFPCPYSTCKRSVQEAAFPREEHLKRHLRTCKSRLHDLTSQGIQSESQTHQSERLASKQREREESGHKTRQRECEGDEDGRYSGQKVIQKMKKDYKARQERLEAKEREFQEERARLMELSACIRTLDKEG